MMQHHIKFGYKRFYSSEYTVQMHAQSVKCSTVPVTLTLNISIQSFHNTPQLVRCDSKWSLVAKKDQQSIRYSRDNPILITATITVTLILKRSNQSFLMTLWLWMMYHHIRSGHKRLMSSEDIVQTHSHTPTQQFWNAPQTLSWWVWTQLASQGSPKMDSGSTWWVHQRWNTLCQGHHVMYWVRAGWGLKYILRNNTWIHRTKVKLIAPE